MRVCFKYGYYFKTRTVLYVEHIIYMWIYNDIKRFHGNYTFYMHIQNKQKHSFNIATLNLL